MATNKELALIGRFMGLSNADIANQLAVTEGTVKYYIGEAAREAGVSRRSRGVGIDILLVGIRDGVYTRAGLKVLVPGEVRERVRLLNKRELDLMEQLRVPGKNSDAEIANALGLKVKTVKKYLGSIYEKLEIPHKREYAAVISYVVEANRTQFQPQLPTSRTRR